MPTNMIRDLLPSVGTKFPALARELALFGRLLNDAPGALSEMPICILTAGFEAIGLAPLLNPTDKAMAGDKARRGQYIEAATFLRSEGHPPTVPNIFMAVRLWGAVMSRAALEYGGIGMHKRCDRPDKAPPKADAVMDAKAIEMSAFATRCALDIAILTAEAERSRALGREAYLRPVRDFMASHPEERHVPPPPKEPSPQLDLFGSMVAPAAPKPTPAPAVASAPVSPEVVTLEVVSQDLLVPDPPPSTSPTFFYTVDTLPPEVCEGMELPAVLSPDLVETAAPSAPALEVTTAPPPAAAEEDDITDENTAPDPEELARFVRVHAATRPQTIQPEAVA